MRDEVAIRIENVSKCYRLRKSPDEKLSFLIKKLFRKLLPSQITNEFTDDYHQFHALKDISLEIKKGESWGFVGVNGSGKSTLLKIISGNLRLSSGRVEVDGKVAILNYGNGFNGEFTGRENIFIKAALLGLSKKQIQERLTSIIEFADIGDFINQPVKTYSSGMVARLGFAIMAHVDADIIITDEALAVGDIFFVQKCMNFIRGFLSKGTFLFVSHSINDVLSLCQQAVWLEHGVIKAIGPASRVTQAYLDARHLEYAKNLNLEEPGHQQQDGIIEEVKSELFIGQSDLSRLMDYQISPNLNSVQTNYPIRNNIEILYNELKASAGVGGVKISKVTFYDENDKLLSSIMGCETVKLTLEVLAENELTHPITGFQVIDGLGQVLFASNSKLVTKNKHVVIKAGTVFETEFTFQMPLLPVGDYTVRAAVAIGEEEGDSVLLQTIDNAFLLRSIASYTKHGLIGVPMQSIEIVAPSINLLAS